MFFLPFLAGAGGAAAGAGAGAAAGAGSWLGSGAGFGALTGFAGGGPPKWGQGFGGTMSGMASPPSKAAPDVKPVNAPLGPPGGFGGQPVVRGPFTLGQRFSEPADRGFPTLFSQFYRPDWGGFAF